MQFWAGARRPWVGPGVGGGRALNKSYLRPEQALSKAEEKPSRGPGSRPSPHRGRFGGKPGEGIGRRGLVGPFREDPWSLQNLLQPSQTSLEPPQSLLEPSKALWTLLQRTLRRPDARARGDRPASKLVPGEFWQHNHHKIITKSLRILIQTLQNLLQPSQTSLEAPQNFLEPFKNVSGLSSGLRTLDSGLRTPYSGLPIETRPLQEIIIKNHKPKSFSSSVEHPHKDSAWFTKSQNSQCEAPPHSVT